MSVIIDMYGLTWGNVRVERTATAPSGHRILTISSEDGDSITVYVSPKGKKIRVFRNNQSELT